MAKRGRPSSEPTICKTFRISKARLERLKKKYGRSLNYIFQEKLKELDIDGE